MHEVAHVLGFVPSHSYTLRVHTHTHTQFLSLVVSGQHALLDVQNFLDHSSSRGLADTYLQVTLR